MDSIRVPICQSDEKKWRTPASYQHIHVLRGAGDSRPYSENDDEREKYGLSSERGSQVADEREDGSRSNRVRAARPDEVGSVEFAYDRRQGGRNSRLQRRSQSRS